jgi:hypothetical protein
VSILENLARIEGHLYCEDGYNPSSLDGFESLEYVLALSLSQCEGLNDISALTSLKEVPYFIDLRSDGVISDYSSLANLTSSPVIYISSPQWGFKQYPI